MNRRNFLYHTLAALAVFSTGRQLMANDKQSPGGGDFPPIDKSRKQWRELLDEARYEVLFEEATERAFTSPLLKEKRDGLYICAACFLPLFDAETKYESGTGWPSFWDVLEGRVGTKTDFKIGYPRTEYHCARCGGHQGHVFRDGPRPTGLRYCNNGLALLFVPAGEDPPPLRT